MREDPDNHGRLFDGGDNLQRAATSRAMLNTLCLDCKRHSDSTYSYRAGPGLSYSSARVIRLERIADGQLARGKSDGKTLLAKRISKRADGLHVLLMIEWE